MRPLSPKGETWWERFQNLLDDQNEWPTEYVFKFIAPQAGLDDLKAVFGKHPVAVRASSKGNYISVTARMEMHSSDEIIAVYKAAAVVEGIISL
ncbi:MAG: DUF493 domain-containing protein [Rhodothermales bacterium]